MYGSVFKFDTSSFYVSVCPKLLFRSFNEFKLPQSVGCSKKCRLLLLSAASGFELMIPSSSEIFWMVTFNYKLLCLNAVGLVTLERNPWLRILTKNERLDEQNLHKRHLNTLTNENLICIVKMLLRFLLF